MEELSRNEKKRKYSSSKDDNLHQDLLTAMISLPYLKRLIVEFLSLQDWLILRFVCQKFAKDIPIRLFLPALQYITSRQMPCLPPLIVSAITGGHITLSDYLVFEVYGVDEYTHVLQLLCQNPQKESPEELELETKFFHKISDLIPHPELDLGLIKSTLLECCRSGNLNLFDKIFSILIFEATFSDEISEPGNLIRNDTQFCNTAACFGHLKLLQYLLDLKFKWISSSSAAISRQTHMLRFAIEKCKLDISDITISCALEYDCLDDWFLDKIPSWKWGLPTISFSLGKSGLKNLIERFIDEKVVDYRALLNGICAGGHFDLIKAQRPHFPVSYVQLLAVNAAQHGRLEIVKWLFEIDQFEIFTRSQMCVIVANGHLEVLKWLLDVQPEAYDRVLFSVATENGRLEILQWFVEHVKFPFPYLDLVGTAYENHHYEVVKYLLKVDCPVYGPTVKRMLKDNSYSRIHRLLIKALMRLSLPPPPEESSNYTLPVLVNPKPL